MPRRSSAKVVSYDLRPAKQCERRLMIESFYTAIESGFLVSEYRYIGMGGISFYDFRLIHKYLGIDNMTSLEHDEGILARAEFNCPFKFIDVKHSTVSDFILSDGFDGNSIYWLDYDGPINGDVVSDIFAISQNARLGDFVFVTVSGSTPKYLRKKKTIDRLAELRDRFPALTVALSAQDLDDAGFPRAIRKLLRSAFGDAFSFRADGVFNPFFQVQYADGIEMVTYGGNFATQECCDNFNNRLKGKIPFVGSTLNESYRIERFNLTEKERLLFDRAVTSTRTNAREIGRLYKLGFDEEELDRYRELLRLNPRYVETLF